MFFGVSSDTVYHYTKTLNDLFVPISIAVVTVHHQTELHKERTEAKIMLPDNLSFRWHWNRFSSFTCRNL